MLQYVTATMETKIFTWLGREFVEISGEAQVGASVESATAALFEKFADSLSRVGLSLDNTARIRVYGRDRRKPPLFVLEPAQIILAKANCLRPLLY